MTPDLGWWSSLIGLLGIEALVVILLCTLAAAPGRSPHWRRWVWVSGLLAISLTWMLELGGAGERWRIWRQQGVSQRQMVIRKIQAGGERVTPATPPAEGAVSVMNLATISPPSSPVWWPGWLWLSGTGLVLLKALAARVVWMWRASRCRSFQSTETHGTHLDLPMGSVATAAGVGGLEKGGNGVPPLMSEEPSSISPSSVAARAVATVDRLRTQMGLRPIRVAVLPMNSGPMAFGVLRPTVAIPADFERRFSPAQQQAILAHELGHLATRDPMWLLIADAVCAMAWWHPGVWWARQQFVSAAELCADEAARLVPDGPVALAEALVAFGRELATADGAGAGGNGSPSALSQRVLRLLNDQPHRAPLGQAGRVCWSGALALGILGLLAAPSPADRRGISPFLSSLQADADSAVVPYKNVQDLLRDPLFQTVLQSLRHAESPIGQSSPKPTASLELAAADGPATRPPSASTRQDTPPQTASPQRVVEAPASPEPEPLHTRLFKVSETDVRRLIATVDLPDGKNPESLSTSELQTAIRTFASRLGIQLSDPSKGTPSQQEPAVFYNSSGGVLMVRARTEHLAGIEKTLQNTARQVMLKVFLCEVPEAGAGDFGLDWLFGQAPTNNPVVVSQVSRSQLGSTNRLQGDQLRVDRLSIGGQSAVLSAEQFKALKERMANRAGLDLLSAPTVLTLENREAEVSVQETRSLVTGLERVEPKGTEKGSVRYLTDAVPVGPTVRLLALAQGDDWKVRVQAALTEFVGYDQPAVTNRDSAANSKDAGPEATVPLPRLRVRETEATTVARPGETIALRGPLAEEMVRTVDKVPVVGDMPLIGRFFRTESSWTRRKRLYVFVQPETIDAKGRPLRPTKSN